jgi:hypothetical protein
VIDHNCFEGNSVAPDFKKVEMLRPNGASFGPNEKILMRYNYDVWRYLRVTSPVLAPVSMILRLLIAD